MQPAVLAPPRVALRAALDSAVAERPDLMRLAVPHVTRALDAMRASRDADQPLGRFLVAAARDARAAPTPAATELWLAASRDPRARLPASSDIAYAYVTDLLGALDLLAETVLVAHGARMLHHPFDAHRPACEDDALAAASSMRVLARRIGDQRDALLYAQLAIAHEPSAPPLGPDSLLSAVVASTLCPQNRLDVFHVQRVVGRAFDGRAQRRLIESARALEDAAMTHVVAPLRHAAGTPHVVPDCTADARTIAARLRNAYNTALDARQPPEVDAPRTAAMTLLRLAHATRCPAVREYLFNYVDTTDPDAARTPLEWRRAGAGWDIDRVRSLPAPRLSLPRLADELDRQSAAWTPLGYLTRAPGQ